ncbi:MAG: Hsp20/alpha crystallin family protein [Ginsengibacter sp.]
MSNVNLNFSNLSSGYPGGYKPNPVIFESLVGKHPLKDEIINKSDFSILEGQKHYKVEVVAPGFQKENIFVSVNEDCCLSVTGIHTKGELAEEQKYLQHPVKYEGFTHEIKLPENIDTDFITAEYKSGILAIWFSKITLSRPKRASTIMVY